MDMDSTHSIQASVSPFSPFPRQNEQQWDAYHGEIGSSWTQHRWHCCHFAQVLFHSSGCSSPCHLASMQQGKLEEKQRTAALLPSMEKCKHGSAPGTILLLTSRLDREQHFPVFLAFLLSSTQYFSPRGQAFITGKVTFEMQSFSLDVNILSWS